MGTTSVNMTVSIICRKDVLSYNRVNSVIHRRCQNLVLEAHQHFTLYESILTTAKYHSFFLSNCEIHVR